ncbi:uncharacterized protein N7459_008434 [Penicillium hispanicum]|uniref:uncharacterized protein n=1 Tax=Penicillium hispanicum TaxID=1080232 RepID=UPI0025407FFB|nr:uncharacterized protein N7459_008434 [Penicillium hispanicum]KAJ5574007.1 hypothetical protein N7459_008434 [Penicillium hispanicum]
MGGKPWQSKGCVTCRKRKIKVGLQNGLSPGLDTDGRVQCDRQEPECGRCLKSRLRCPGYEKRRFFVHEASPDDPEKSDLGKASKTQLHQVRSARPMAWNSIITLDSGPAKRQLIFSSYMLEYFPLDVAGSTEIDPWYHFVVGISVLPKKSPQLERALAAISCIFTGRRSHDKQLYCYGLQLYNSAIQLVSQVIAKNIYSDDLMYTVTIFQMLVSIHCPHSIDVWLDQMKVTDGILEQFYPRTSGNILIKMIYRAFKGARVMQSISLLQAREAIDPVSTSSLYSLRFDEDTPLEGLFQLMAEMSTLFAAVGGNDGSDLNVSQALLVDCLRMREKLTAWWELTKERIGGDPSPCAPGESIVTRLPPGDHLFGAPYRFSSLDNARMHLIFWAALSILQVLIGQAQCYVHTSSLVDLKTNQEYLLSKFYADELSRSIPFCLQSSAKSWGAHVSTFAMSQIAKVYLEDRDWEKFAWSQHVFRLCADLGSDFSARLGELLQNSWILTENHDLSPVQSLPSAGESQIHELSSGGGIVKNY